jgi:hypothetical protein
MAKPRSHKAQHFVPQCYLKAWVDPRSCGLPNVTPYIWRCERDGSSIRPRSPKNLFTETDIYTIVTPEGRRDLRLEKTLGTIEDKFTRIRKTVFERREALSGEDLAWVHAFVATAKARTQAMRDHHVDQLGRIRARMEELQRDMMKLPPEKRLATARALGRPSDSSRAIGIDDVRRLEENPLPAVIRANLTAASKIMPSMSLAVLESDDLIGFITSDTPCVWFDPDAHKRPLWMRSPGLATPSVEITLPISPRQCLFFSHVADFGGYRRVPDWIVDELNRRQVAFAMSTIVSQSDQTRSVWFSEEPVFPPWVELPPRPHRRP